MAELTERQQEIKDLLDRDKTPGEIAEALGITENAVYQHLRRMREKAGTPRRGRGRPRATAPRRAPRTETARETTAAEPRSMTPLQAIRARKAVLEHELRSVREDVASAERTLKSAQEVLARREAHHAEELGQLNNAEAALTGKPAPTRAAPKRARKPAQRGARKAADSSQTNGSAPEVSETPAVES